MFCLNLKNKISKSGHPKMQNPIMLFLVAPPGNSYYSFSHLNYIKFSVSGKKENEKKN